MRDYKKFFTPDSIAKTMAAIIAPLPYEFILDACAGSGNLAKAVRNAEPLAIIDAIEIDSQWAANLQEACDRVFIADIENWQPEDSYDKIISNPPFGNDINFNYIFNRLFLALKKRGALVMICPADFEVHHNYKPKEWPVDNWATNSDGTKSKIKILKCTKP